MKKIITRLKFVFLLFVLPTYFQAQNAALLPGNIVSCNTTIYDRGGTGNYTSSSNEWITIAGIPGSTITISGTYGLETCNCDYIYVRDGYGNAGTILQTYTNGAGAISYTGTSGQSLTVQLVSDGSVVSSGFVATVTYSVAQTCPTYYSVSGSGTQSTTCGTNYILKDHAGDNTSYNNNRNDWIVLNNVSGSPSVINIIGRYATESTYDFIRIYDGSGTGGTLLTSFSGAGLINYSGTAGQTLTVQFTSDGGTVNSGFSLFASYSGSCVACTPPTTQATSIVVTPTANTTATASWVRGNGNNVMVVARTSAAVNPVNGTTYTANTNYGSGSAVGGGWCVYNGSGTSVNVTGLTANTTYFFDVYEYATTATCYLTPALSGSTKTFNNGNNVIYPTTGGPVSYTQCSGIFYDNGGAGSDYSSNLPALTRPVTFYPVASGDKVVLTFTSFATESATCATNYDWLKIYNGNSTAAALINCYSTGGVTPGTITSTAPDGSLTIDFKSDGTPNGTGWAASISCYSPCGVVAGTSSSSITQACGATNTTLSLAGEGAGTKQWQQSTDGGSNWSNIAGATTDPYVFAATVNAMFRCAVTSGCTSYSTTSSITFSCDIIHPSAGFASTTIQCGSSYTYKDPGNTGNYGNDQNGLITICPSTAGQYVNVNFTAFNTESGFDYIYVFDGGDAGAPILGIYSGNGALSGNVKATASNSSGCLSFRFYSDGGTTYAGWQGTVTCSGTPSATVPSSNPEDCQGAYIICNNGTFTGGTNNYGFNELPDQWNSCLGNAGQRGEYESTWAVFSPATSGTVGISITPTSAADYDWAIWGPYSSLECPAFNNDVPVRCSSSSLASTGNPGTTGLIAPATDVIEQNGEYGGGANENGKLKPLDVLAGEIYVMMLDNWDANTTSFALNWNLTNGATLDCTPILPVTMSSFNNTCKNGNALLEWSTASETNNDYFAIERSNQDFQFYEIGRVMGSGNSNINNSYSFLDPKFNDKTTYYRIKQVDFNGEFRYHRIVASNCYKTEFEVVSHQLTSDNLDLLVNSFEEEDVIIYLYDLQGRLVIESNYQLTRGNNKIKLNSFNINSGIYLLNIRGEVHHYQTKLFRK